MKNIIFAIIFLSSFSIVCGQNTADLNGVTLGFGIGPAVGFDKTYDYTLSTDPKHVLKIQPLNKGALVISTVVMFKLGKLALDQNTNNFVKQDFAYNKRMFDNENTGDQRQAELTTLTGNLNKSSTVDFIDRLSINFALNLVNISQDVSFNTKVDGGIGLGYLIREDCQIALFLDISRVSQMRDFIVSKYTDKPIPNGDKTYYNSLDFKDNNLFYNRTVSGLSIKFIYSFGNTKPARTPPAS